MSIPTGQIEVHAGMLYRCPACGHERYVMLDRGVEEDLYPGRPRVPCPFLIPCDNCLTDFQQDKSGLLVLDPPRPLQPGMWYFEYPSDVNPKERMCGKLKRYI